MIDSFKGPAVTFEENRLIFIELIEKIRVRDLTTADIIDYFVIQIGGIRVLFLYFVCAGLLSYGSYARWERRMEWLITS